MNIDRYIRCCRFLLVLLLAVPVRAQVPFWAPAPGPYGGTSVQALVVMPAGDVLAGAKNGVFRSRDGGVSWQAEQEGLPGTDARALLVLPDGTVLAGLYGAGVYSCAPGASAWTATGLRGVLTQALLLDRNGSIYAGTAGGLLRSDDDGVTWRVLPFFNRIDGGVQVLAANDTYVFAGTKQGLYRSSDGGGSWESAVVGLRELDVTALAVNAAGHVFAGTSAAGGSGALYRSRNQGSLWTSLFLSTPPFELRALAAAPDGTLYAGGFRTIYHSTDEGDSWTHAVAAPASILGFAFTGNHVVAATAGRGVVRAALRSKMWTEANEGLLSVVNDVVVGTSGEVYAGTAGGVYRSADRGASWTLVNDGLTVLDVRILAIDPQGRPVAGTASGLFRLGTDTQTWSSITPPGSPAVRDVAFGPDSTLYAGYFAGVYHQKKGGLWEQYLLRGPDDAFRDVIALYVDGRGAIYAGSYWDAFRADPGVTTWSLMALIPTANEGAQTFLQAPDGTLYAGTRYSGVLYSTDRGGTWAQRVNGLTGLEDIRALALDTRGRLYAGTYGSGVFRYDADVDLWRAVNDGLQHRRVVALTFDAAGNGYAATLDGGLYRHTAAGSVAREAGRDLPASFALHGNYPNPFNPSTTLAFDLPAPARVSVEVFDLLGRRVLALPAREAAAGPARTLVLDAGRLASGLYLYRVHARHAGGVWHGTGRMLLVR